MAAIVRIELAIRSAERYFTSRLGGQSVDSALQDSLAKNNLAFYHLELANELREDDAQRSSENIDTARSYLEELTSDQTLTHPIAFATSAEVECFQITLDAQRDMNFLTSPVAKTQYDRVMEFLRKARDAGYRGFQGLSSTEVVESVPYYKSLQLVEPDRYLADLQEALGLKTR